MLEALRQAAGQGELRHLDYYFAEQLAGLDSEQAPLVALVAALASQAVGNGHICLDLKRIAGKTVLMHEDPDGGIALPPLDRLITALEGSAVVGAPGSETPLILDETARLYLGRYWWYEQQVAETLLARAQAVAPVGLDLVRLQEALQSKFPAMAGGGCDWQKVAAAMAVLRPFAVISGGPGTGKTRTVTSILALLLEQAGETPLRVALAAPTGKAAARLTESIRLAKPAIACHETVRQRIPEEATTLHRLLGVRPGRVQPRHHAGNPLHVDLLVVDEASMIDLPLMARLLGALSPQARLILLGDKDQLASVEAGSVFADITGDAAGSAYSEAFIAQLEAVTGQSLNVAGAGHDTGNGFGDSVALLRKSYRFTGEKGIGPLATAINAGKSEEALALLKGGQDGVGYQGTGSDDLHARLVTPVREGYLRSFDAGSPREALARFNAFRILCAVRGGPMGVEPINAMVENILRASGAIQATGELYPGRPVMVTRNDYGLGLFNGDVGIIWPDPEAGGALRGWFLLPDNTMKRVLPSRLPAHETAYAMTVHKSQGSEFDRVLMLLPPEVNPVLTRELLYTGITRAKRAVEVWGTDEVIRHCIRTQVARDSGLGHKLYTRSPARP